MEEVDGVMTEPPQYGPQPARSSELSHQYKHFSTDCGYYAKLVIKDCPRDAQRDKLKQRGKKKIANRKEHYRKDPNAHPLVTVHLPQVSTVW
jgi:hypothetical protein